MTKFVENSPVWSNADIKQEQKGYQNMKDLIYCVTITSNCNLIMSLNCFSRKRSRTLPDRHQIKAVKEQIKAEIFIVSH